MGKSHFFISFKENLIFKVFEDALETTEEFVNDFLDFDYSEDSKTCLISLELDFDAFLDEELEYRDLDGVTD